MDNTFDIDAYNKSMTKYIDCLRNFDFEYQTIENYTAWSIQNERRNTIFNLKHSLDPDSKLFNEYRNKFYGRPV